jgi:hypothetical protein
MEPRGSFARELGSRSTAHAQPKASLRWIVPISMIPIHKDLVILCLSILSPKLVLIFVDMRGYLTRPRRLYDIE